MTKVLLLLLLTFATVIATAAPPPSGLWRYFSIELLAVPATLFALEETSSTSFVDSAIRFCSPSVKGGALLLLQRGLGPGPGCSLPCLRLPQLGNDLVPGEFTELVIVILKCCAVLLLVG